MNDLDATDLGRVARFLGEIAAIEDDEPFPPELLAALRRLVPCDWVGFSELDRVQMRELGHVEDPLWEGPLPEVSYWEIRLEHPACHYHETTGDFRALKLSDFMTRRELHRSRIYQEWFRPFGTMHQLTVGLDAPLWHTKVFLFDRCPGRDFTERDKAVLDALRPHLAARYAAAQERTRLRDVLLLVEQADASVVLLDKTDRIAFATETATELLQRYFGPTSGRVPKAVTSWLRASAAEPLTVDDHDRSLVVRAVGEALLLEERAAEPRLTPREREILELVADGLTNAAIAERLWLSPGTVRRHLENVYEKLGVHTRTAAAAFVRQ
jgi:DNA-binding CsgD family transcriptional regulator